MFTKSLGSEYSRFSFTLRCSGSTGSKRDKLPKHRPRENVVGLTFCAGGSWGKVPREPH